MCRAVGFEDDILFFVLWVGCPSLMFVVLCRNCSTHRQVGRTPLSPCPCPFSGWLANPLHPHNLPKYVLVKQLGLSICRALSAISKQQYTCFCGLYLLG